MTGCGMTGLALSKADRVYILEGLGHVDCGYARELAERIKATECSRCRGTGYAPYVGGDDDDAPCLTCEGSGFE